MKTPKIIQGGMGIAVSNWVLARAVSQCGEMGVVSGTAVNSLLVRKLQDGDPGGHMRRALAAFPFPQVAEQLLKDYFIDGGKAPEAPYKRAPLFALNSSKALLHLTVASGFCEVYLAKEGHSGLVGINLLEKVQLPNLSTLYGAMLADVDYVLMGAGIPREIPGALDLMAVNKEASLKIPVEGSSPDDEFKTFFDPRKVFEGSTLKDLKRPYFLPIIASATLGMSLARKATGKVDGLIVEGPTAGGHNAPPRGAPQFNQRGEPIYGAKDVVDLQIMRDIGLPFWLAGSYATPEKLNEATAAGASGIQVGTAFAFCDESGFTDEIKQKLLKRLIGNQSFKDSVFTDPRSSPTGFPFKAVMWEESLSDQKLYEARPRICDLGYLRHQYKKPTGDVGYRCPAEPVADYVQKGGLLEDTVGRKCLCNSLMANIGHAQHQKTGYTEMPLITAGDDYADLARFISPGATHYSAKNVIDYLYARKG